MIYMQFGGGLGNQMFQYAYLFAQNVKETVKKKNIISFMHRNNIEDRRDFSLGHFGISLDLGKIYDEDELSFSIRCFIKRKRFEKKVINQVVIDSVKAKVLSKFGICSLSEIYNYYDDLLVLRRNVFVEGAFQNWRYFEKYSEEIRREFEINTEPSDNNKEMLQLINESNSVCVHIRRGDFLNSSYAKDLAICDYNYYHEGIRKIACKVKNPVFFIFSNTHDDIEWIKNNYKFEGDMVYVDLNNPDYEELRLMMNCKHFIISNSTYSWWAQYLSKKTNKIVIAPSKWNNDKNVDTSGIYMPEWELVEV